MPDTRRDDVGAQGSTPEEAVLDALASAEGRLLWLTCPGDEVGLEALARRLRLHCARLPHRRDVFLDASALAVTHPLSLLGRSAFIVGPRLHEMSAETFPPRWRAAIDGAVLLAQRRHTTEAALALALNRLLQEGIKPLGLVWNPKPPPPWPLRGWRGRKQVELGPRDELATRAPRHPSGLYEIPQPPAPGRVISPKQTQWYEVQPVNPAKITSPPIPADILSTSEGGSINIQATRPPMRDERRAIHPATQTPAPATVVTPTAAPTGTPAPEALEQATEQRGRTSPLHKAVKGVRLNAED